MKTLNQYIKEKLIINQRFDEKLIINKDYHDNVIVVKSFDELRKIIEDRYNKLGPGTEQKPIDFNDIDVSDLDSFCNKYNTGIFSGIKFNYIDISYWDVSNVKEMRNMFYLSEKLKSVGDISEWDVSNVTSMTSMFDGCILFNQDLSKWNVSKVRWYSYMFDGCPIKDEYKPKFK